MRQISDEVYNELIDAIHGIEEPMDYDNHDNYMSDGEWLDVLYDIAIKIIDENREG